MTAQTALKGSLIAAAAVPGAVLVVVEAVMLVVAALGDHPLWRSETLNLSEAAALRDAAELVRLIDLGHDPTARQTVRGGFLDSEAHDVTPLEAAVYSNRPELVDLLMSKGARLDGASWARLRCFAREEDRDAAGSALDAWRPAGVTLKCSGRETAW